MTCAHGTAVCGDVAPMRGRMKLGWCSGTLVARGRPHRFCTLGCLEAAGATLRIKAAPKRAVSEPEPAPIPGTLADLNRMAGTHLTVMDATPARISLALARAYEHLVADIAEQARRDAQDRPTISQLLEEAIA